MLFLASMGETGLTHDIFFEFSLGPFEVVEAQVRIEKKMSWVNPVSPKDAKNSIGFFVQFFLS